MSTKIAAIVALLLAAAGSCTTTTILSAPAAESYIGDIATGHLAQAYERLCPRTKQALSLAQFNVALAQPIQARRGISSYRATSISAPSQPYMVIRYSDGTEIETRLKVAFQQGSAEPCPDPTEPLGQQDRSDIESLPVYNVVMSDPTEAGANQVALRQRLAAIGDRSVVTVATDPDRIEVVISPYSDPRLTALALLFTGHVTIRALEGPATPSCAVPSAGVPDDRPATLPLFSVNFSPVACVQVGAAELISSQLAGVDTEPADDRSWRVIVTVVAGADQQLQAMLTASPTHRLAVAIDTQVLAIAESSAVNQSAPTTVTLTSTSAIGAQALAAVLRDRPLPAVEGLVTCSGSGLPGCTDSAEQLLRVPESAIAN